MKYKNILTNTLIEMLNNLPDPEVINSPFNSKVFTGSQCGKLKGGVLLIERVRANKKTQWCIKVRCE